MKAVVKMSCSACNYDMPSIDCEVCAGEIEYTEVADVKPLSPMAQLTEMFGEFNDMYGLSTKDLEHNLDGMRKVVGGEYDEWNDEIADSLLNNTDRFIPEPANFVKEGLDVVYAMLQQLTERGVDVGAGLAELHRSNMSKTVSAGQVESEILMAIDRYPDVEAVALADGRYVLKSPSMGKVVKPTAYSPANISPNIIKMAK